MGTGGYTNLMKLSGGRWKEVAGVMMHHGGSTVLPTFKITRKSLQNITTFQNKTYLIYIHIINHFINLRSNRNASCMQTYLNFDTTCLLLKEVWISVCICPIANVILHRKIYFSVLSSKTMPWIKEFVLCQLLCAYLWWYAHRFNIIMHITMLRCSASVIPQMCDIHIHIHLTALKEEEKLFW